MLWLSHYTRAQYKTKKETNVLIIAVIYLVLLLRESLKGGWGWVLTERTQMNGAVLFCMLRE